MATVNCSIQLRDPNAPTAVEGLHPWSLEETPVQQEEFGKVEDREGGHRLKQDRPWIEGKECREPEMERESDGAQRRDLEGSVDKEDVQEGA